MTDPIPAPTGKPAEFSRPVRLDRLARSGPVEVAEVAESAEAAAVAALIGAERVAKFRISGRLHPVDKEGWRFSGQVGATVTQPCVVTLAPVKTRIDVDVTRLYVPGDMALSAEIEIDPEEREEAEPLPQTLDLGALAVEELVLALPDYPRAPDAEGVATSSAPPGAAPDEGEREKPFAALAGLKEKMRKNGDA